MTHSLTYEKKQLFDNCESIFAHTTQKKNHLSKQITPQIIFILRLMNVLLRIFHQISVVQHSRNLNNIHIANTRARESFACYRWLFVSREKWFSLLLFLLFCHFLRFVCSRNASQSWFNTTTAITIETVGLSQNFAVQWLEIRRFTKMQRQFICRRSRSAGMRRSLLSRDLVVKYSTRRFVRRVLQFSMFASLTIFSTSMKRIHICAAIWKSQASHSSILCWPHSLMER